MLILLIRDGTAVLALLRFLNMTTLLGKYPSTVHMLKHFRQERIIVQIYTELLITYNLILSLFYIAGGDGIIPNFRPI